MRGHQLWWLSHLPKAPSETGGEAKQLVAIRRRSEFGALEKGEWAPE